MAQSVSLAIMCGTDVTCPHHPTMACCRKVPVDYDESVQLQPCPGELYSERVMEVRGQKRNILSWLPDPKLSSFQTPTGLVLIAHGLHEHALRYYAVAHGLTARGFAVYALDHVGHGKSDGVRGLIPDYNILVDDFVKLAEIARAEQPAGLPTFVLCHSMGTVISILAIPKIPDVKAAVFSGCALATGPGSSSPFGIKCCYPVTQMSIAVSVAKVMAAIDPKGPAAPLDPDEITSDGAALAMLKRDPRRVDGQVKNKTAFEFLKMSRAAKAALPSLKVPFLSMHGGDDTIAYPKGSQILFDTAGTDKDKKKLEILPGLKHEIFQERLPDGPQCVSKAVEYICSFV